MEGKFRGKRRLKEEKQTQNKRRSWQSFLNSKGTSLRRDYISQRETQLLENTWKTTPNSYSGTKQAHPTPSRRPLAPERRNTHLAGGSILSHLRNTSFPFSLCVNIWREWDGGLDPAGEAAVDAEQTREEGAQAAGTADLGTVFRLHGSSQGREGMCGSGSKTGSVSSGSVSV